MLSIEILYTTGYFTADYNTAMASLHLAMFYDDITAGNIDPSAVCIASRFNGNAIVPCIKCTVRDKNVRAAFRVAPVRIWAETFTVHVVNGDVLAKHRVN
jgi:hypothetical protein